MKSRTYLALGAADLLWSSAFVAIRSILQANSFTPGHIALGRFIIASLLLVVVLIATRSRLPKMRDIPAMLFLGIVGITVYHSAQNYGQQTVTAGSAGMIIGSVPIFMSIAAVIVLKEKLKIWGWLGIIVGFGGVVLIAFGEKTGVGFNLGVLYLLIASVATAIYFVLQKPYFNRYTAIQMVAFTSWAGTLGLLIFTPGLFDQIKVAPVQANLAIIYLGIFSSVAAYICWNYGLSKAPASAASSFLYLQPIITVIIAWIWLREIPPAIAIGGGALTIAAVFLVNRFGLSREN
jgi:drug/metabolite transporter (DMT)-like permease